MSAGQLNQIVLAKETTWGTAVTPAKAIMTNFGGGIQTDQDVQMIAPVRATLAKNIDAFVGKRVHEGDYEMDLFEDHPGYFLVGALGAVASALASGETAVYNHTITEAEAKPSFTIEQVVGENVRRFAGCLVQSIKIVGKTGEAVMLSVGLKAKSQASATKVTPTYLTNRALNWANVDFKVGGVSLPEVTSFELEYTNNLEVLHALNASNDPAFNYVKGSEVKGKIEFYLNATTLAELNNYISKTTRAVNVTINGDTAGVVPTTKKLVVDVPKAVFTAGATELSEDYNLLSIEFEGLYDTAISKLISMTLTNQLANYN